MSACLSPDPQDGRDALGRFVPGRTGNARGRPVGSKSVTAALREVVERELDDGRSVADVIADRLASMAMAGDLRAIGEVLDRIDGRPTQRIEARAMTEYAPLSFRPGNAPARLDVDAIYRREERESGR